MPRRSRRKHKTSATAACNLRKASRPHREFRRHSVESLLKSPDKYFTIPAVSFQFRIGHSMAGQFSSRLFVGVLSVPLFQRCESHQIERPLVGEVNRKRVNLSRLSVLCLTYMKAPLAV